MSEHYISNTDKITTVQYYDGIGRPTISAINSNGNGSSYLYSGKEYFYGQMVSKEYLPVAGGANPNYISAQDIKNMSSQYGDDDPFIDYKYDILNRTTNKINPGKVYKSGNHDVRTEYSYCDTLEVLFFINGLHYIGYYPKGGLTKEVHFDEDGRSSTIYKDLTGNTVMQKEGTDNCTYYIYNYYGMLIYVIPPSISKNLSGTGSVSSEQVNLLGYQYTYDSGGHLTGKQLPGCQKVNYKLDNAYRTIFTQDGEMKTKGLWEFSFYDSQGRLAVNGITSDSISVIRYNGGIITANYTGNGIYEGWEANLTLNGFCILQSNYYDNYAFLNNLALSKNGAYNFVPETDITSSYNSAKGCLTGTLSMNLDFSINKGTISNIANKSLSVNYYDVRGNIIESISSNILEGTDIWFMKYNSFTGNTIKKKHLHTAPNKLTITENYTYNYDNAGRVNSVKYSINNKPEVELITYSYDGLGRVKNKKLGNGEDIQYSYNLRNLRTSIESANFIEHLSYEKSTSDITPLTPRFNGKISGMLWKIGNNDINRTFLYNYDSLDRLNLAKYGEGTFGSSNVGRYSESFSFDSMGNLTQLQRDGLQDGGYGLIDDLTYSYNGNQVVKIDDCVEGPYYKDAIHFVDKANQSVEYEYDKNGNMTKDLNSDICNVEYNCLNLPLQITSNDGTYLRYEYNSKGEKIKKIYSPTKMTVAAPSYSIMTNNSLSTGQIASPVDLRKTYYCGNIIYNANATTLVLNDVGYSLIDRLKVASYHYNLTDHLGNVRVVLDEKDSIEQVNHYYSYGGLMGCSTSPSRQPYKFNGKEFDTTNSTNLYDYGARWYNPSTCIFTTPDPLAEKYYGWNMYAYCKNDPINRIDPDGRDDFFSNTGKFLYSTRNGSNIFVKQGKSFTNFSDIKLSSPKNTQLAANIIGHYAKSIGIKYDTNGGTGSVGVSRMRRTDKAGRVLAAATNGNIYIKLKNAKLDVFMYNFNNLSSTLTHENEHKKNPGETENKPEQHAQIALKEMSSEPFSKSSPEYQQCIIEQFEWYIESARERGVKESFINLLIEQKEKILRQLSIKF